MKMKHFKLKILLFLLILISVFLHFYHLNWGAPYYFHPDERNIASAVSQLSFPSQMNPHFFAYGSLPIYTIYFTGVGINFLNHVPITVVTFSQAIVISRLYSALFATPLIPLLFVIARNIVTKQSLRKDRHATELAARDDGNRAGLIAAFLGTTSIGLIQFAHFGTFELWLTLFTTLLFWLCLCKMTSKTTLLIGIVFGVLVSTKISSLILLPILLIVIPARRFEKASPLVGNAGILRSRIKYGMTAKITLQICKHISLFLISAAFVYLITNPYVFADQASFFSSMRYESGVVLGTQPVFYTGEFFGTIPILFQFLSSYPFLLNPLVTFLFVPAFAYLLFKTIQKRNPYFLLLTSYFPLLFFSQAFLFAKWTRYLVPTLPFIYVIIGIFLSDVTKRLPRSLQSLAMTIIVLLCCLFSLSYFITAFVKSDTRVSAKEFAVTNIPSDAPIISEVYDLGITPFNDSFPKITLINPYELDNNNPATKQAMRTDLAHASYLILPSQRVLKVRLLNDKQFPNANKLYRELLSGKLSYQKIYETPCDIFCKITYLGNPTFRFEETVNVFDRPTVFIFKK